LGKLRNITTLLSEDWLSCPSQTMYLSWRLSNNLGIGAGIGGRPESLLPCETLDHTSLGRKLFSWAEVHQMFGCDYIRVIVRIPGYPEGFHHHLLQVVRYPLSIQGCSLH
jgi:hypothetical protein